MLDSVTDVEIIIVDVNNKVRVHRVTLIVIAATAKSFIRLLSFLEGNQSLIRDELAVAFIALHFFNVPV